MQSSLPVDYASSADSPVDTALDLSHVDYLRQILRLLAGIINSVHEVRTDRHEAGLLAVFCDRLVLALYRKNCDQMVLIPNRVRRGVRDALPRVESLLAEIAELRWTSKKEWEWAPSQRIADTMTRDFIIQIQKCVSRYNLSKYVQFPSIEEAVCTLETLCNAYHTASGHGKEVCRENIVVTMERLQHVLHIVPEAPDALTRAFSALRTASELVREPLQDLREGCEIECGRGEIHEIGLGKSADLHALSRFLDVEGAVFRKSRAGLEPAEQWLDRFRRCIITWARVYEGDEDGVVLPLWAYSLDETKPYSISPAAVCSVEKYINDHPGADRLQLLTQMARCIKSLHGRNIVHGSIKHYRFVVMEGGDLPKVTVTGWYAAQFLEPGRDLVEDTLDDSGWLTAPERVQSDGCGSYGKSADVWSFACLVWNIVTSTRMPLEQFALLHSGQTHQRLPERPTDSMVIAHGMSEELYKLVADCWAYDAAQRPTMEEVVARLEKCHAAMSASM